VRDLSAALLDELVARAALSPRRRQHLNLHASHEEPCQRLLNAIGMDSYIQPHRHLRDPRHELLIAVRGSFSVFTFDDSGILIRRVRMEAGGTNADGSVGIGVETTPHDWHTVIANVPGAVLLEIKAGPFDPSVPKDLAPWAPVEDSDEAAAYFSALRGLQ
jgi:cupin fold WbuC family metalloprotein